MMVLSREGTLNITNQWRRFTAQAFRLGLVIGCLSVLPTLARAAQPEPQPLFPSASTVADGNGQALRPQAGGAVRLSAAGDAQPRLTLSPSSGTWDLSRRETVRVSLRNLSDTPLLVRVHVQNETAEVLRDTTSTAAVLAGGESRDLDVRLVRRPEDPGYEVFRPFMMYYDAIAVRDNTVDPAAIARIVVALDQPRQGQQLEVQRVIATGEGQPGPVAFFPFIDRFGQYIHADWPGKIRTVEDFAKRREEEVRERAKFPGAGDWNAYGGWKSGPQLEASGNFRVTKHDGKWWLVDPEGRLFWSNGVTGAGFGTSRTPISDREHWFAELPDRDGEWKDFFGTGRGATYRYYKDREWVGLDVSGINLKLKYGAEFKEVVGPIVHDRLRSWGFNTMGGWSSDEVAALGRTPYTVVVHYGSSPMIHYRMPDVYSPQWEPAVRASMERHRSTTANDRWNIGYFVDNERWWGPRPRAASIGEETLKNPPERHAKLKFVEQLRTKYDTIDALNAAWGTTHASWDAFLAHREPPDMKREAVLQDCGDFGMAFAERYFSVVRDIVKSVAPNNLYLGPRFHGHIDVEVVRLAGKYCDVVSYNIYDNPPTGRLNQYRSLDLPFMSTEWGIGTDPRQSPFRGRNHHSDATDRTNRVGQYLRQAIRHPNLVGAHFFQYRDQPTSGRPDGEASLRGYVNIADTPNFDLIQVNRRFADTMYRDRAEAK
jgi:hypothetical protein